MRHEVLIILLSPHMNSIFLYMPRKAMNDGRENWCVPQGGVESGESIEAAVRRELQEEFCISVDGKVESLCTLRRDYPSHHPKGGYV